MQKQSSTTEEWRQIPGWEGFYDVSNHGRVKSFRCVGGPRTTPRVKKLTLNKYGYWRTQLCRNGRTTEYTVHRLVLLAFVGPPPTATHQAAHGNGDRKDNRPSNLRWATPKENAADRARHGTAAVGERSGMAKFTNEQVRRIRVRHADGAASAALIAK